MQVAEPDMAPKVAKKETQKIEASFSVLSATETRNSNEEMRSRGILLRVATFVAESAWQESLRVE